LNDILELISTAKAGDQSVLVARFIVYSDDSFI